MKPIIRAITAERFSVSLSRARRHNGRIAAYVSEVSPETARGMAARGFQFVECRPFTDTGYHSPASCYLGPDGYLGGLYSRRPGLGRELLARAISLGASRLDCLGDELAELYREHGFRETLRAPWDDELQPDYWPASYGTPDYIEMERN